MLSLLALIGIFNVNALTAATSKDELKTDIHKNLHAKELHQIFGTEDISQVPKYEIVYPHNVDQNAKRSQNIRRNLHHSEPMYLHFNAFGKDFHLGVTENKDLVPDNQFIEHHSNDGVKRYKGSVGKYSTGKIVSDETSNVALDHTSGLNGMLIQDDEMYMIAPVPQRLLVNKRTTDAHGAHIIYRRSALPATHPASDFNCGVTGKLQSVRKSLGSRRKRRSLAKEPEKTLELMVAADKNAILYHGKEHLHSYLLNQANIVAGIYKDPTLEYPVTIAVTRVVLLDNDVLANATDMMNLLHKFQAWFYENSPSDENDPLHVDNGALLTKGGCADGCGLAGLAAIGICHLSGSQSVTKDKGLMSAVTMAHELAHNLGVGHDSGSKDVPGECPDGINLMASGTVSSGTSLEWSNCSSKSLAGILRSSNSWCLNDKPVAKVLTNVTFQHYGLVYDGTKQCELAFGKGYKHCPQYKHQCSSLFCERPTGLYCDQTSYPAAHGTHCSPYHWCIYGECVRDGSPVPPPIHGGWSAFGEYTTCNRECGGGLQWRERTCTNPVPQHGGKQCEGSARGHQKTCNFEKVCSAGTKSFRQVQCDAYSMTPVVDPRYPCLLLCTSGTTPLNFGNVEDGTRAYDHLNDVCIGGVVRKVGCDLVLESGAIPDRCSQCGGDGSTCAPVTVRNLYHYSWTGIHDVGSIPSGTLNMHVRELAPSYNFISVKVGTSGSNAYYVPDWSKDVSFAGLKCRYTMQDYNFADDLKCTGVSNDVVRPTWANYYGGSSPGIEYKYFIAAEGNTSAAEYAVADQWGACSKSCGGGIQNRELTCRRTDDKSAISLALCKSLANPVTSQSCNTQACPPQWYIHPWGECSKTCGTGQKYRNITCSQLHADGKYYQVSDQSLCTATKPTVALVENCNVIMCNAEWVLGEWGPCSTTCGQGVKIQQLSCKRTNADGTVVVARELECAASKPSTVGACNIDNPCPIWVVKYAECSKSCGGGLQYPYAACYVVDVRKNDSECDAATKPDISKMEPRACNIEACDSYEWKTKDGTCSVSCGDGVIPINVTCIRVRDSLVVADELCANSTKPATTKACNAGDCPEVYEWKLVPGPCSVTCGTGTTTDIAACFRKRDGAKVEDILCEISLKPAPGPAKECVLEACPETYSWNVTYGACSATCGEGTKEPIVKCTRDSDKVIVDDSKCNATKPVPGTMSCNTGECPVTYKWKQLWGPCSATCGKGTKTSHYKCYMVSTDTEMSDSYCADLTKPGSSVVECTSVCNWAPTYGPCLPTCGSGYKLTTLQCQSEAKAEVDISNCAGKNVGSVTPVECSSEPCQDYAPSVKDIPKFYALGCYKDSYPTRLLPVNLGNLRNDIDWNDMSKTVIACARLATKYKYFGIQYYGECWAGNEETYYLSGTSTECYMGTGREFVNYVYSFNGPVTTTQLPPVMPLGCFYDDFSTPRPLPLLIDNFRSLIEDHSKLNETLAATIVSKCAKITAKRGFNTFGIQFYGECWSGPTANVTYNEDGKSSSCQHKLGLSGSFYVYKLT